MTVTDLTKGLSASRAAIGPVDSRIARVHFARP
jgi:hypothetical protein